MKDLFSEVVLHERARRGGRRRFTLLYGMVGWGLPVSLVSAVLFERDEKGFTWSSLTSRHAIVHILIWIAVVGVLGGYMWGRLFWAVSERNRTRTTGPNKKADVPPVD